MTEIVDAHAMVDTAEGAILVPIATLHAFLESVVRYAFNDALADRLAEAVALRLAAPALGMSSEVYSSNKRGPHIPGKTRHWTLRNVRTMPGARKVGRDWQISRLDFERWMTE